MTKAKRKDTQSYRPTEPLKDVVERMLAIKVDEIRKLPGFLFWEVERQKKYIAAYSENFRANHGLRDQYTDAEMRRFRLTLLSRGLQ